MARSALPCLAATLCLFGAIFSATARAECGGSVQCIGVGPTQAAAAVAHHDLGPATFTMTFTQQALGTTSVPQTIFVEAVTGPPGTMAALGPVTFSGSHPGDFLVTGGSCTPSQGPVHGGSGCTITVAFRPTSLGDKVAVAHVPLDPPGCVGCITERTVTVAGSVGRANPARDATVLGVLAAQSDAARRFSQAQIANAHHRMESLHRRGTGSARAGATRSSLESALASLVTTGSVDITAMEPASPGASTAAGAANFWLGGIASFGSRDSPDGLPTLDFRTDGLSIGVDRAFGEGFVAGLALGGGRDRTEIGANGSGNRARGASAMAYASFAPGTGFFLDVLAGGGSLDFRSRRLLAAANGYAEADRGGRQAFASIATGYEWVEKGLLVAPYARADVSRERFHSATETGPAGLALSYAGQSNSFVQGAVGLRAESNRDTRFGRVVPRVRTEFLRTFRSSDGTSVGYADLAQDPPFAIASSESTRNALLLGLGADFLLRNGLTLGIDYQLLRESARDASQSIRLNVSQALDGRGAGGWAGLLPMPPNRKYQIQVDAGLGYDDNVSRARGDPDVFSDDFFSASVRVSDSFPITARSRAVLAGTLGGEKFRTYRGLSRASAGLEGELQYRPSSEFVAPTLALFARAATDQYESRLRDGHRYAVGVSASSLATDRIGLFASLSRNRTDARGPSFDASESAAKFNVDYRIGAERSLYLAGEYRRGDLVLSTNPSLLFTAKDEGPFIYPGGGTADDVFVSPQLVNYRVDGRTVSVSLGYNLSIGPRDSLDFSWRRVRSTPSNPADLPAGIYEGTGTPRYTVNQFLVLYLMSF